MLLSRQLSDIGGLLAILSACLYPSFSVLAADWAVPNAPIRFNLSLQSTPSHPDCGYFIQLPDGGILPKPLPNPQAVSSDGTLLPTYLMWYNKRSGPTVVFAAPTDSSQTVDLYFNGTTRPMIWEPKTGIFPSAILCTNPQEGNMNAARRLAQLGAVGPTVHYRNKAGIPMAPLSLGEDSSGRPAPTSFYLLSHVITTDPGKTWIAPFAMNGSHSVVVNGETINPSKRIDKWGGTGQYVDLPKGLNRIEIFASIPQAIVQPRNRRKAEGIMYLTWRTPKASMQELGGVRSKAVPFSGTSRMETRVLRNNEIARSGQAQITGVQAQDGSPVAYVKSNPVQNFWFEGEQPSILYEFSAMTDNNPEETQYTWDFGMGARMQGPFASWIAEGFAQHQVSLTATLGERRSQTVFPYYGYTRIKSSLDNPNDRLIYREICTAMLKAYPPGIDPTLQWNDAQWANLFRTLDFSKGYFLLQHLFGQRWKTAAPRLSTERMALLQDALLEVAPRKSTDEALGFARVFRRQSNDLQRKNELLLREAEIGLYYLNDTNQVLKILQGMVRQGGEAAERARIRLGDMAFLNQDLNLATKYYSTVQNKVRHERNATKTSSTNVEGGVALNADRVGNWKLSALLDTVAAEHVKTQIDQGYLEAAKKTLDNWERQFPLSKISGDFILQEARLYIAAGDYNRARPMLEAFCQVVDASSYLPDTALLLMKCMTQLKEPPEEISAFATEMRDRLKFHPLASRFEDEIIP